MVTIRFSKLLMRNHGCCQGKVLKKSERS
uniref:Uncharacterized protein n=1 Tax=Solanum lycopersicum TaxID=4081 RepID=A0A3Q7EXL7_SOLLC